MIDYWDIKTDDWLLRRQNRWLITEASKQMIDYWGIKTDDWLLRWPLLVYGGTEGSKEQIANSNGVDRCFKRMVIWQSFLALFNCWWIHPWSDVDIDARIFKTLCQKLTYVMCRKKHHNFLCVHKQPSSAKRGICNLSDLITYSRLMIVLTKTFT